MLDFAAFTITRNESLFLRVWANYYVKQFGEQNCYILDNSTTDNSVIEILQKYPKINVISKPNEKFHDIYWLKSTVEAFQKQLLKTHKVVIFAETDEFLLPYDLSLLEYCKKFLNSDKQFVRATGWNAIHDVDAEPAVKVKEGNSLLANRNNMWRIPPYDKTLITKIPLVYGRGFHHFYLNGNKQENYPKDENLALMHAFRVDFEEYCKRHLPRLNCTKQEIKNYFKTDVLTMAGYNKMHAIGPRTDIPSNWIEQLVF